MLLREHEEVGSFLQRPALAETPATRSEGAGSEAGLAGEARLTERVGDRIGRYRLLQPIGEGGCGVVYLAEQEEPVRRRVALKVIKMGMDTRSVIARFEAERQALAMMDHPNIARVLDAGATEAGRPYFVMELVRGVRITEYCDENRLPTEQRLRLFIQVCQAVQHAHQKGIIHRDLKPSNILVTLHDGVPVPKIIDFGIAKATEQRLTQKTLFTEFRAFIGTPAYMSPEQAEMSGLDIDTRSDIYSLGVLLYELLTGRTPFDPKALMAGGLDECRRTIREQEPARPSTRLGTLHAADLATAAGQRRTDVPRLLHQLRGDLDWIVMKCLEKDRTRRYETANALAVDIERYLGNEPVLARPPSNWYRLHKLLRRHRLAVGAGVAIAVALLAGAGISTWQAIRARNAEEQEAQLRVQAEQERERAQQEKAAAHLNEYVADMNLAQSSIAAGNYGRAAQLVDKHWPEPGEPDLRGFEWRYLWRLCRGDEHKALPGQDGSVTAVAVAPDGRRVAVGTWERLNVYDISPPAKVASLSREALALAFLPDGKTLISASGSAVRVWRTADWTEQVSLRQASGPIALSADGRRLAAESRGGVRLWETATWAEVMTLPEASGPMAFSPDAALVATSGRNGVTLWSTADGQAVRTLEDSTNLFFRAGPWFRTQQGMAFSGDGKLLAAVRNAPSARGVFVIGVWDVGSGKEKAVMPADPERAEHTGLIAALAMAPDGHTVATASWDHSIRCWDLATGHRTETLQGHLSEVWALAFAPDGGSILSGGKDGGVNLWPLQARPKDDLLPAGWTPWCFSADGRLLAAVNAQGTLGLINLATQEIEQQFEPPSAASVSPPAFAREGDRPGAGPPFGGKPEGPPPGEGERRFRQEGPRFGFMSPAAFSGDLRVLARGMADGSILLRDTITQETSALKVGEGPVDFVLLSPDGRELVCGGRGRSLSWRDLGNPTGSMVNLEGQRAMFSPNGRYLAVFGRENTLRIWDVARRTAGVSLALESSPGFSVAFSPDGQILATTAGIEDVENAIRLWRTTTGAPLGQCVGHKQSVWAVAFAPDGRSLASSSDDGTVKLWNVATQQELLSTRRSGEVPRSLLFSPDGTVLVGMGSSFGRGVAELRLFRAPSLAAIDSGTRVRPAN